MAGTSLLNLPSEAQSVSFREGFGQRFIVTVDTEEEFDWNAPLQREGHSLETIPALRTFQQFCEGFGVVPSYMLDYPIATDPRAAEILHGAVAAGQAEIGVQLHPWVSPPFEEVVTEFNSYAGNLPPALEREKFSRLHSAITSNFGAAPLTYRAGRYGLGPNTLDILKDHGIAIDTSVRALFDYSHAGGPNFRNHPLKPYWVDAERKLMEMPLTTVYWGMLRQAGNTIYPHMWRTPSMRGVLARASLLERIPLTPEGVTAQEAIRGVDIAIDSGLPILVFSFHSPSLAPGHTPYVRNEADLATFYDWWRQLFGYLAARNVRPTSVSEIMASVALA